MNRAAYKAVLLYHERSKHHFQRYARSLGYMDWANQPNPFRFYEGTEQIALPLRRNDEPLGYMHLYQRLLPSAAPLTLAAVGGFLELSLGLSAWKGVSGAKWSLRMNPSSGNLHPTEAHLVLPPLEEVGGAALYHYNPLLHVLERRATIPAVIWENLRASLGRVGFLIALTSIYWREAWKYGERAFRYCNHDIGHALAGLGFAANLQGWKLSCLSGMADEQIDQILGLDRMTWQSFEQERAEIICCVCPANRRRVPLTLPEESLTALRDLELQGSPNALSRRRVPWEIIEIVSKHTRKPATAEHARISGNREFLPTPAVTTEAAQIIRRRRSAVAFTRDGQATKAQFLSILDKTLPRRGCTPFDVDLITPQVHLLIFVHQVKGLDQGLYFFFRDETDLDQLRRLTHSNFDWQRVTEALPLYFLQAGNQRQQAMQVSCHQDIAGDSIFSLGMVARFREFIRAWPYRYRHLFWEAGMIGQVLYLEAEAHGLRGTGIGCYFDDAVHDILGLQDNTYQSLYHFTVGKPLEDERLMTFPPYHHLSRS